MKNSLNLLLLLLPLLGLAGCNSQTPLNTSEIKTNSGIIGGQPASANDPVTASTVSLLIDYNGYAASFCSGTLISKNLVLTATHCLQDMDAKKISVFFGESLPARLNDPRVLKVKTIVTHPGYKFEMDASEKVYTGYNDVGLVLLESEAPASAHPVPVLNDTPLKMGQTLLLAGYGLLDEIQTPPVRATGLNQVHITIAKLFSNIIVTEQSQARGACAGDSGGPAYLETEKGLIVLGITRGPYNLARDCRHWGEYTYASRFKEYILTTAQSIGAEAPVFVDAPLGL